MKKTHEFKFLEHFLELYPINQDYKIINSESPDFILQTNSDTIGIEITRIYQDLKIRGESTLKKGESIQQKIASRTAKIVANNSSINLQIDLDFYSNFIDDSLVDSLSNQAAKIVLQYLPTLNTNQFDYNSINSYRILPNEISSIFIMHHKSFKETFGTTGGGGLVPDPTPELIQIVINRKENKLSKFKPCSFYWLIIAEGMSYASMFDDFDKLVNYKFESSFDKVFVLRTLQNSIIKL